MWCQDYIPRSLGSTKSKRIKSITLGEDLAAGVAKKFSVLTTNCLQGSTQVFLSRFISIAFSVSGYDHRAVGVAGGGVLKSGFFSLYINWLSRDVELHLPEATGYEAPVFPPLPILWLRTGLCCQKLFEMQIPWKHFFIDCGSLSPLWPMAMITFWTYINISLYITIFFRNSKKINIFLNIEK